MLKIDKDCVVDKNWIDNYVATILQITANYCLDVETIKTCYSKKKGMHFYIKINDKIDAEVANMIQWLLGDDSKRVDFNRARIQSGLVEWNKLFEVPQRRLKTIYRKPKCD